MREGGVVGWKEAAGGRGGNQASEAGYSRNEGMRTKQKKQKMCMSPVEIMYTYGLLVVDQVGTLSRALRCRFLRTQ